MGLHCILFSLKLVLLFLSVTRTYSNMKLFLVLSLTVLCAVVSASEIDPSEDADRDYSMPDEDTLAAADALANDLELESSPLELDVSSTVGDDMIETEDVASPEDAE